MKTPTVLIVLLAGILLGALIPGARATQPTGIQELRRIATALERIERKLPAHSRAAAPARAPAAPARAPATVPAATRRPPFVDQYLGH